ncbi:MAG: hypothetical protein QOH40_2366 [Arthrobacter pascens]|jgi:hypothetical protein|nr:hypothetical protein [Arthrobacter pascens]
MKTDQNLDTLLRSLDAAKQSPQANPTRAQADLARILSSEPVSTLPSRLGVTHKQAKSKTNRRRRAITLGGLAAAVTAGLLIMPALSKGGDPAFATWTAAPGTLIGSERDNAVSDCRRSTQRVGGGMYSAEHSAAEVAIAERRGAWVTVVLTGPDGFEASCTTDATAPWFSKGSFGSVGKSTNSAALPARGIAVSRLGTGMSSDKPLSIAAGRVGPEVAAITYTNSANEEVIATVSKGHFAFWLPGNELENAYNQGAPVKVTYTDGSTDTQLLKF